MAEPNPTEVAPWYLRNITQALELNEATGQVFVRTDATIVGNVTVSNVAIGSLGNVDLSNSYLPVSVTGNIAGITGNITVNPITGNVGILGNVNVTQGTSPWVVSGNVGITGNANVVLADDANVVISGFSGPTSDAFGRLRVSEPFTLFDSQNRYLDGGQFSNVTATGGTITYVSAESSFDLAVTAASGPA